MSDKIGIRIKELRVNLGLTQEELGEMVGVKKAAINKYESGLVRNIKRDMQEKLAKALNTDPAALFYPDATNASSSAPSLTPDEEALLESYRKLNTEDKAEVRGFIKGRLHDYTNDITPAQAGIIKKSEVTA